MWVRFTKLPMLTLMAVARAIPLNPKGRMKQEEEVEGDIDPADQGHRF